jgi:hypothetical protein
MVKCCANVVVVFYWLGSGKLVWANGDWAKKAAFPAPALLLALCLSHFHILTLGLRLKGMIPRDWWFPSENISSTFHGGIPSLSTCWPRLYNPPLYSPKLLSVPTGQLLAMCCFVCPLLLQQFKQDLCFQFSEMETSVCNFENPCQSPRLLFWSSLSDMWVESPMKFKRERPL